MLAKPLTNTQLITYVIRVVLVCYVVLVPLYLLYRYKGIVTYGLRSDAGTLRVGDRVLHKVLIFNLNPSSVTVFEGESCGCQITPPKRVVVKPFHTVILSTAFRVESVKRGHQKRDVLLSIDRSGELYSVVGSVEFKVK